MRAAAVAAAVIVAFLGVMYVRFSGDAVPPPSELTALPTFGPSRIVARSAADPRLMEACENFTRYPKPPQCAEISGADWPMFSVPPSSLNGIEIVPLKRGSEIELPADIALIIETGCFQCDGPTTGLSRVYRDPSDAVRAETLFSPEKVGLTDRLVETAKGPQTVTPCIRGFAVNQDASEMIVGVGTAGFCISAGFGFSGDAEVTLYRSVDGGITWSVDAVLDHDAEVVGLFGPGSVLLATVGDADRGVQYERFPGGEVVIPPSPDVQGSIVLSDGGIIWTTEGGSILRSNGTLFFEPAGPDANAQSVLYNAASSDFAVTWSHYQPISGAHTRHLLGLMTAGGQLTHVYETSFTRIGAWLDSDTIAGNTDADYSSFGDYLPSLIDLGSREVHQIVQPFRGPLFARGRNHIVAVQRGPFARVANTDNTCLNIRVLPNTTAASLECAAEGVLLRHLGQTAEAEGFTWLHVATPSGIEGWASTQYLEY